MPTFLTGMFFSNDPQNLSMFTSHLGKVTKAQKFALSSSGKHISTRVSQALVTDPVSTCRFAYAIYNASNIHGSFTFPITIYSLQFMMHTKNKPNK